MLLLPHSLARPCPLDKWQHGLLIASFTNGSFLSTAAYLIAIERYLDDIWQQGSIEGLPAWEDTLGIYLERKDGKLIDKLRSNKEVVEPWVMEEEKAMVLANIGFAYVQLGLLLAEQLLSKGEASELWKGAIEMFKKALAVAKLGAGLPHLGATFSILQLVADALVQLLVIANMSQSRSTAFGMLSRAAIYATTQLATIKSMVKGDVLAYIDTMEKYARSYAAYYTAVDHYNQKKIGHALGLVQVGLIGLQGREEAETVFKPKKKFLDLRRDHKNDKVVKKSTGILKRLVDTGIPADALSLLARLLELQFSYTKENDTLAFQDVVGWRQIGEDAQWPLGKPVPLLGIPEYAPGGKVANTTPQYSGQGSYY